MFPVVNEYLWKVKNYTRKRIRLNGSTKISTNGLENSPSGKDQLIGYREVSYGTVLGSNFVDSGSPRFRGRFI